VQSDLSDLSSLRHRVSRDWLHAIVTGDEAERRDHEQALRCIDYLLSQPSESIKPPHRTDARCPICRGTGFDAEGQPLSCLRRERRARPQNRVAIPNGCKYGAGQFRRVADGSCCRTILLPHVCFASLGNLGCLRLCIQKRLAHRGIALRRDTYRTSARHGF